MLSSLLFWDDGLGRDVVVGSCACARRGRGSVRWTIGPLDGWSGSCHVRVRRPNGISVSVRERDGGFLKGLLRVLGDGGR